MLAVLSSFFEKEKKQKKQKISEQEARFLIPASVKVINSLTTQA